ncbi:MAG: serine hydroxymethyltransferase, partial [Muribaculaceae bacterium]|nr:serine hydroxymethyltransferase [Muribaculaceae bacterium]
DSRTPFQPAGLRLGTPAVTTRGADMIMMTEVADLIDEVLRNTGNPEAIASVRERVNAMMAPMPIFAE